MTKILLFHTGWSFNYNLPLYEIRIFLQKVGLVTCHNAQIDVDWLKMIDKMENSKLKLPTHFLCNEKIIILYGGVTIKRSPGI